MIRFISLIVLCLAIPIASEGRSAAPAEGFADLVESLLPSVVNISTTKITRSGPNIPEYRGPFEEFLRRYFGDQSPLPERRSSSLGSGFVIDGQKGLIITNHHVIQDADEIVITFHDNVSVEATLLSSDEKTDIAILQVTVDRRLAEASFGDSDEVRVGDWVVAIGNPYGLGGTVTAGIVSARGRNINAGPYTDFIQTDAPINPGNSGGPMFNLKGEVIGINTAIYSRSGGSVGIGFAIPSALSQTVIDQLLELGRTQRGWLGVSIQQVDQDIAEQFGLSQMRGALISSVNPHGPALKSGLQTGDIILRFNNIEVEEMRRLPIIVSQTEIGRTVPVVVWRQGQERTFYVTIGELEEAESRGWLGTESPSPPTPSPQGTFEGLGLTLSQITPDLVERYSLPSNSTEGIVITRVDGSSEAARKNLAIGDVILEFNHVPVPTIEAFAEQYQSVRQGSLESVLLRIRRGNQSRFLTLALNE